MIREWIFLKNSIRVNREKGIIEVITGSCFQVKLKELIRKVKKGSICRAKGGNL